jgi:predicted DNA-binding transcriptional regulator YafY
VIERIRREWYGRLAQEQQQGDEIVVTLLAYSLEWLAEGILSYGSSAEVLSPARLRELVAAEAAKVAAKYVVARRDAWGVQTERTSSLLT